MLFQEKSGNPGTETRITKPPNAAVYNCESFYQGILLNGFLQGCQMVYFQTKFWRALEWKMLVYLWSSLIFQGHLYIFKAIW
jgi:hypothetical protein